MYGFSLDNNLVIGYNIINKNEILISQCGITMKSLNKAFDIMEYILNQDGAPVTPSNIAADSGLNTATCVRILNTLVKRGYIEKVSRRAGYVAGPALFGLSMRECPYSRLMKASETALKELALKTSSMVNISVMLSCRRYILNYYSAVPRKKPVSNMVYYSDHYVTATGRLLMSTLPTEDIESIIAKLGLPDEDWPDIKCREDLFRELARIKEDGIICYKRSPYWIIGGLVCGESCTSAAIGFGIDEHIDPAETLEYISLAIKQIKSELKVKMEFH